MYIRRKVFSVIEDENGEERYFSTTEFISEENYLEQRDFSSTEEEESSSRKKKRRIAQGMTVLGTAGAAYGYGSNAKYLYDNAGETLRDIYRDIRQGGTGKELREQLKNKIVNLAEKDGKKLLRNGAIGTVGAGLALAGTAGMIANRKKKKKNK